MDKINVATVFSGIGAAEQAFIKLKIPHQIIFACDNGERELNETYEDIIKEFNESNLSDINILIKEKYESLRQPNHVKTSYFSNYKIKEDDWYEDIRFIEGKKYNGKVDILIGGSPCQSFSSNGKRAGLEDARGTLFYDYARLIKEIEPKVFIYENVTGMMTHNRGETWKHIREIFGSLNYKIEVEVLNSKDFGIPQNRRRLFVVGWKDLNKKFVFPSKRPLEKKLCNYLEKKVESKYYLGQKGFEFVTNPKYKNRAKVNQEIIQTQKANQQFNWNGDFVFEPIDKISNSKLDFEKIHVGKYNDEEGVIRMLTHRECARLMGFPDSFKIVVPRIPAYRQIGNSIVVNVLESMIENIIRASIL